MRDDDMQLSSDYWCYQCARWFDGRVVEFFNDHRHLDDDDIPTVCPLCGDEVVWWSTPEGRHIAALAGDSESEGGIA